MPRYKKGSVERAVYKDLQSLVKSVPKVAKPRKQETVAQPDQSYAYPTLTMRQTHILLVLVEQGLRNGLLVDDKPVTAAEWQDLLRALFRG